MILGDIVVPDNSGTSQFLLAEELSCFLALLLFATVSILILHGESVGTV